MEFNIKTDAPSFVVKAKSEDEAEEKYVKRYNKYYKRKNRSWKNFWRTILRKKNKDNFCDFEAEEIK